MHGVDKSRQCYCLLTVVVFLIGYEACDLKASRRKFTDEDGLEWGCSEYCPGIRNCRVQCCDGIQKENTNQEIKTNNLESLGVGVKVFIGFMVFVVFTVFTVTGIALCRIAASSTYTSGRPVPDEEQLQGDRPPDYTSSTYSPELQPTNEGSPELQPANEGSPELQPANEGSSELQPANEGSPELQPANEGSPELQPANEGSPELQPANENLPELQPAEEDSLELQPANEDDRLLPQGLTASTTCLPQQTSDVDVLDDLKEVAKWTLKPSHHYMHVDRPSSL